MVSERLQSELDLLEAMYPDCVHFNPRSSELNFHPDGPGSGNLLLRLPDTYPENGAPEVVVATDKDKADLRESLSQAVRELCDDLGGGEVLDAVISRFIEVIERQEEILSASRTKVSATHLDNNSKTQQRKSKTVIIWLHHLLATSKRKLALHPSSASPSSRPGGIISGISKPGYPGVLLFTGPKDAVDDHVAELKSLNWQAFSVRYEEEQDDDDEGGEWLIAGKLGGGIKEVESMSEMVQMIEDGQRREAFLKSVGVK